MTMQADVDILTAARDILGPLAHLDHRGWATWWCPFHDDIARRGQRKKPNFGVNIQSGQWKCLRCGASGGSINSLRRALGIVEWRPAPTPTPLPTRPPTRLGELDEAIIASRNALRQSCAWPYLAGRGIRPYTTLTYGLGYGLPTPHVHKETIQAAMASRMMSRDGYWLWARGVVYADPPTRPETIQVRHLRQGVEKKYQTWGRLDHPLGAWRIGPATRAIVVVEGMFDMLAFAQALHERGGQNEVVAVYTAGAATSAATLDWFTRHGQYEYLLAPDADKAGGDWTVHLAAAIRKGGGALHVAETPGGLDPDQAILQGWWPAGL